MVGGLFERIDQRAGASEGTRGQLVDVVTQEVSLRHVALRHAHEVGVDAPMREVGWCSSSSCCYRHVMISVVSE